MQHQNLQAEILPSLMKAVFFLPRVSWSRVCITSLLLWVDVVSGVE